jgi:hypothetical protein
MLVVLPAADMVGCNSKNWDPRRFVLGSYLPSDNTSAQSFQLRFLFRSAALFVYYLSNKLVIPSENFMQKNRRQFFETY